MYDCNPNALAPGFRVLTYHMAVNHVLRGVLASLMIVTAVADNGCRHGDQVERPRDGRREKGSQEPRSSTTSWLMWSTLRAL